MTDNRTTEQRISKPLLGFIKHQRNRGYIDAGQAQWLFNIADEIEAKHEQAIAATLGSGTLTAEHVRETVEKHWHDLPDEYDMPEATALPEYSYDWQAIADELNVELGSGTCKLTETDSYSNANETIHVLECSECGETCEHVNGSYPRCPHCGRKVVSA